MYIQDNAYPHSHMQMDRFHGVNAASMPELFLDDQYAHSQCVATKKRKRSDEDDPANIRIISKPEYQLDFLNSPFIYNQHQQQTVTVLQSQHDATPPIVVHPPTTAAPSRQKAARKPIPPASLQRSNTAPLPQLQVITDLPSPSLTRRISSPAISPKTIPISMLMLKACHICHRRPFTRNHLDSYINCDICSQRTCYICMRECGDLLCLGRGPGQLGMDDEARKACSGCSVEGGIDGEIVRCMECMHEERNVPHRHGWNTSTLSGNTSASTGG